LRLYIKIIFVIILISVGAASNSKNIFADDIEKFAPKLLNHYEYEDKITNYLKSFFLLGIMVLKIPLMAQLIIKKLILKNKCHPLSSSQKIN